MKNILKLIFYLFNLGYYTIGLLFNQVLIKFNETLKFLFNSKEAMNADLVCPAILNSGDNLKCDLTLVNSKISNLIATFNDGVVKTLDLTPSN